MANTLEMRLYSEIKGECRYNEIVKLINKGADCNWTYFDFETFGFLSPIQIIAGRTNCDPILCLLYEKRNYATDKHLQEHINFYTNHYSLTDSDYNDFLLLYIANSLLHTDVMKPNTTKEHDILNVAIQGYDHAWKRGEELSIGSQPQSFLQLRIFSLVRLILAHFTERPKKINDNELEIMKKELLHNLEIYYFIQDINTIPVNLANEILVVSYDKLDPLIQSSLTKYYRCIARNVIEKIKRLNPDDEYTIPSGWEGHAVCVSFRRINERYIHVRVDNSLLPDPDKTERCEVLNGPNKVERFCWTGCFSACAGSNRSKPVTTMNRPVKSKILGQLAITNLDDSLDYFIRLLDCFARNVPKKDGQNLIYNTSPQILPLKKVKAHKDVPEILEQARANCFVKCFEFGFQFRLSQELCENLIDFEKETIVWLQGRYRQKKRRNPIGYYIRFATSADEDRKNPLLIEGNLDLHDRLKASYRQKYQYLPSFMIGEYSNTSMGKYVYLKLQKDELSIDLENVFVESRVLLLADAGCGKTTICDYIAYTWSCNKLWNKKFTWLFYIKIRNLNSLLSYSLLDIIEKECFQGYKLSDLDKHRLDTQLQAPSHILWIIDGLDERGVVPEKMKHIVTELLSKPNLLLTSRPYVIHDFQHHIEVKIDKFTEADIEDFVKKFFSDKSETMAEKCYSSIQSSEQLKQAAQTPACLLIICHLWEDRRDTFNDILTTEALYEQMCQYLLQRYLIKFCGANRSDLAGENIFNEPDAIGFAHLEYLAFRATASDQLTFSSQEIRTLTNGLLFEVVDIGLLTSDRNSSSSFKDNYSFIHRSFQEYLCCRYMIRILTSSSSEEQKEEILQFIANKKYDRAVQETFRLFFKMEDSKNCSAQFWSAVDREPRDLIGLRHCARIWYWFPGGSYLKPCEENNVDKRTKDVVVAWISNENRRGHHSGDKYLFDWFYEVISHELWSNAWKDDLFMEDSSQRRYFLADLWSPENIAELRGSFESIPRGTQHVKVFHRLIQEGPTLVNLEPLHLKPNNFVLPLTNDSTPTLDILVKAQKFANERQKLTNFDDFRILLQNYPSFAQLNCHATAKGKEVWPLKIAESAVFNVNNETLELLLRLIRKNQLFYRDFTIPVLPFLRSFVISNDANEDTLCSLIVSIALSSECILTTPSTKANGKLIRVHTDETVYDIELNERRWLKLINTFERTRTTYGYCGFCPIHLPF